MFITNRQSLLHFISQCAHESFLGQYLTDTVTGDDPLYKGSGYIKVRGRSDYESFGEYIGDPNVASLGSEYVSDKYPFLISGFWWHKHGLDTLCEEGASVEQVTHRVNGGYEGLDSRRSYYIRALGIF